MSDKTRIASCQEQLASTLKRVLLLSKHAKLELKFNFKTVGGKAY